MLHRRLLIVPSGHYLDQSRLLPALWLRAIEVSVSSSQQQPAMAQRPVPARRRNMNMDMSSKNKLIQSFVGFNSSTVSEEHMRLARECIKAIPPRNARYEHVPFHMIVQWNEVNLPPHKLLHFSIFISLSLFPGEAQLFQYDSPGLRSPSQVCHQPPQTQEAASVALNQGHELSLLCPCGLHGRSQRDPDEDWLLRDPPHSHAVP